MDRFSVTGPITQELPFSDSRHIRIRQMRGSREETLYQEHKEQVCNHSRETVVVALLSPNERMEKFVTGRMAAGNMTPRILTI